MLLVLFTLSLTFVPILTEMNSRIVNGDEADIRQFSYAAALLVFCKENKTSSWRCGGSIINQHVILTAAHCLAPCQVKAKILVGVGSEKRSKDNNNLIEAKDYRFHKGFKKRFNFLYDIGLVLLECPLKFNGKVGRIILMPYPPMDATALVAGWGRTQDNVSSEKLMYATQEVFTKKYCIQILRKIQRDTICAGTRNATMYPAPGDSGGALVVRNAIQIGVVSYRKRDILHIAVYTEVSKHYAWIMRTMEDMLFCNKNATNPTVCSAINIKGHKKKQRLPNLRSDSTILNSLDANDKSGFPYTASITIICEDIPTGALRVEKSFCGASIINERMLLTAAVCLVCGSGAFATVVASVGNDGKQLEVRDYRIHEQYNSDPIMNNIAVILLKKPLVFSKRINKVVLTSNPQYDEPAKVVEISEFDDSSESFTLRPLVYINQHLLSKSYCQSVITPLPPDSLCAAFDEEVNLAPGNALVIENRIQIGLVSFVVGSFVVYTDTSRFFDWISTAVEEYKKVV